MHNVAALAIVKKHLGGILPSKVAPLAPIVRTGIEETIAALVKSQRRHGRGAHIELLQALPGFLVPNVHRAIGPSRRKRAPRLWMKNDVIDSI